MSYTGVFGGTAIQTSQQSYLALALSANTTLVWPRENQASTNVVADIIDVTPTSSAFSITMPDARQGSTGICSVINNLSGSFTFVVKDSAGNTILTAAVGTAWLLYLQSNATAAGTWRSFQFGAQAGSINVAAIAGSGLKAISTSLNQTMSVSSKSGNYTVVDGDRANVLLYTGGAGTFTLPSAGTVGSDWFVQIRNSGTGDLAVTPPAGTIDGAATKTFAVGGSGFVFTDGTNFFTIGYGLSASSTSFDYTTINVAGTGDYTIAGAQLNRISYYLTGVLTGNRNLVVPASVQQYWINNGTTGAFTLTVKTAAGTGIVVTQGNKAILYCDGTNVLDAQSGTSLPIAIASGGTGATTAAAARTNLGSTAIGDALFITASAAAARTTLGSTTVGDALFIAASASAALTVLAGGTLTGALTVTALLTAGTLAVTSATVPSNGLYLPSANTIGLASNTVLRWSVNSTGAHVIAAPSAGTALTLTGVSTTTSLVVNTGAADTKGIDVVGAFNGVTKGIVTNSNAGTSSRTDWDLTDGISTSGMTMSAASYTGSFPTNTVAGTALSIYANAGPVQIATGTAGATVRVTVSSAGATTVTAPAALTALTVNVPGATLSTPLSLVNTTAGGGQLNINLFAGALGGAVAGDCLISNGVGNMFLGPNVAGKKLILVPDVWTSGLGITIASAGNVTVAAPSSGTTLDLTGVGGGNALTLRAGNAGDAVLFVTANGFSTGAATATLSANKPGGNTGVSGWLQVNLNGVINYIPCWT